MRSARCPRLPTIAAVGLLAAGCAGSGSGGGTGVARESVGVAVPGGGDWSLDLIREDGTTSAWMDASPEEVWLHLPAVYATLGLGPETFSVLDPRNRQIAVRNHRTRRLADQRLSRFLYCGESMGQPKIDNGNGRVHLATRLDAEDGGTMVRTRLEGEAHDSGRSTAPVRCSSSGRLERIVMEQLAERVARKRG